MPAQSDQYEDGPAMHGFKEGGKGGSKGGSKGAEKQHDAVEDGPTMHGMRSPEDQAALKEAAAQALHAMVGKLDDLDPDRVAGIQVAVMLRGGKKPVDEKPEDEEDAEA